MTFTAIHDLDAKWQKEWEKAKIYESDPDPKKKKKYITAAFPYPNSPQHIGHARTYTTTDIYARYWRLQGYNVLFPMAFHVTGTPILAMAKRIAEKDEDVLSVFEKIYGIDRKTAATLTEPKDLVMYFSKEIEAGMKEMGYSIDWRRKFYSFDQKFNKFIQWQFKKLKGLGLIVQGEHAVPWCPKDNNAVGGHDTKGDVDPELKEFTAVKFDFNGSFILTATLRPETISGVTNIWVNPNLLHVKAKSKKTGEIYIVSKLAAEKMNLQGFELHILEEFKGEKLINKKVKNLFTGQEVPVYPANYVKGDAGTGVVMSVPSHAPYDHIALVDMGINLEYEQIIQVDGYKFMAKELIEQRGIKDQNDPRLEEIKAEVYKKEILTGRMLSGPFKGEKVSVAIEKTRNYMFDKKLAFPFWEIENKPVYCRCGAEVVANVVKNQWFINYGDQKWKEKARDCISAMDVIPDKNRADYLYTVGWLKEKACTRAAGLGTKFPFDPSQMIEALSDSTIYMAFYTIAHLLHDFKPEDLDESFFDAVLLGNVDESTPAIAKADKLGLSKSFHYWYPLDSRHSGADLVRNHLPFFILNHVAIFQKKYWPKQIVTNGFVLMDGKKMSKSMGNILPLRKAIKEYGSDIIRFSVVSGADITQDTDFNKTVAEGTKTRIEQISKMVQSAGAKQLSISGSPVSETFSVQTTRLNKWINSRLNRKVAKATELYEKLAFRELALEIFYGAYDDLKWYGKRNGGDYSGLYDYFRKWAVLISPFMPHYAEEFWHTVGGKGFVVSAEFPKADEKAISNVIEFGESIVSEVREDIENLHKIIKTKPKRIWIFVANKLKRDVYSLIAKEKKFDLVMKAASSDPKLKAHMDIVQKMAKSFMKNAYSLPPVLSAEEELEALESADSFFENEFQCEVSVVMEDDSENVRAKNALPSKPSIAFE